jgi:predicted DNA-binding protein
MITLNIELQPEIEQRLNYLMSKQTDVEHFFKDFIIY